MKIEEFHRRVWSGLLELQRKACGGVDDAKIVVHPKVRAMLAREAEQYMVYRVPDDGTERYRGQVLELDPRIGEDCILIRYEVEV